MPENQKGRGNRSGDRGNSGGGRSDGLHRPIRKQEKKYPARVVKPPVAVVERRWKSRAANLSVVFIKTPGIFPGVFGMFHRKNKLKFRTVQTAFRVIIL